MALQWTTIDLPWAGGIDGKRHPYLRELPKAQSLVNLRFQQSGALVARGGVESLGGPSHDPDAVWRWNGTIVQQADETWIRSGNTWRTVGFSGPRAVEVAQRPILRSQEGASTVASAVVNGHMLTAWTRSPGGEVYVVVRSLETGAVTYGPTTITGLDVTAPFASSLRAVAHETSYVSVFASGGLTAVNSVTFSISTSGATLVGGVQSHTGTSSDHYEVHTEPTNSQIYLVTDNGSALRLVRLTRSALTLSVESAGTLTGAGSLNSPLGVCLVPVAGHVIAMSTSASSGAGDVQAWITPAGVSLPASISASWSVTPDALVPSQQTHIRIAARADGSARALLEGFTSLSPGGTVAEPLLETPAGNIGATGRPSGVWQIDVNAAGDEAAATVATWHVYLGSSPVEWQGAIHAVLLAADVVQSEAGQDPEDWIVNPNDITSYLWSRSWASRRVAYLARFGDDLAEKPKRVAEFGHDVASFVVAASPVSRGAIASVPRAYVSGTELVLPMATVELGSTRVADIGAFSNPVLRSLREYRLSYGKTVAVGQVGGPSLLASGYLAEMDGDRLGETMMAPPVFVDVWVDNTTAGAISAVTAGSTCAWVACWEWRDAYGRTHRSAPSDPITMGTSISGAGFSARVAIPPFIDAELKGGCLPKDTRLVIYATPQTRTLAAQFVIDDTYWAQSPGYGIALEDLREASYPWMTKRIGVHNDDRTAPAASNELSVVSPGTTRPLYTNGDVLENDPPVSPLHMATTRERVWIIDSESRDRVYFSKPLSTPEIAPEFSAALFLRVPTEAGELTALAALDDLVIFFSDRAIYALDTADAGPDSTGAGDWPPLRQLSRELGCVNAATVAATDVGVFFASASGVQLLGPTGQITWVGRDLSPDIDWTGIVSTAVVPDRREVVFAAPTGCYVFDYDHGQWSTTVYTASDGPTAGSADIAAATELGGELVLVSTEGIAWQEDASSAEEVTYQVRTGWIHLAGLQGFQRIRRIGLLGRITFDPALPGVFEAPPELGTLSIRVYYDYDDTDFDDYSISLWDVVSSSSLDGRTQLDPMRLRQYLARQKCEALSVRITVSVPSVGDQQVYAPRPELAGLALEVGAKQRLRPWGHSLGAAKTET